MQTVACRIRAACRNGTGISRRGRKVYATIGSKHFRCGPERAEPLGATPGREAKPLSDGSILVVPRSNGM